jgi:hypothetical protein
MSDNTVVVPVILGERAFEHFIFDTGAGVSTLTEKWLPSTPHRRLRRSVISVDASGVRRRQSFVEVKRLCFLGRCKTAQTVMPDDDLSALNGFPVDGILGMTFFRGSRIVLDLPRSQLGIQ